MYPLPFTILFQQEKIRPQAVNVWHGIGANLIGFWQSFQNEAVKMTAAEFLAIQKKIKK